MFRIALVFSALLAVAVSSPLGFGLGAPLLSKVSYEPAEVKTFQPEITVKTPEYRYNPVPYALPYPQPVAVPEIRYALPAAHPLAYTAAVAPQPFAYSGALPYAGYFPYAGPVAYEVKKD